MNIHSFLLVFCMNFISKQGSFIEFEGDGHLIVKGKSIFIRFHIKRYLCKVKMPPFFSIHPFRRPCLLRVYGKEGTASRCSSASSCIIPNLTNSLTDSVGSSDYPLSHAMAFIVWYPNQKNGRWSVTPLPLAFFWLEPTITNF